ncbi:hypothetical protein [Endozoicomonas acroporae]
MFDLDPLALILAIRSAVMLVAIIGFHTWQYYSRRNRDKHNKKH